MPLERERRRHPLRSQLCAACCLLTRKPPDRHQKRNRCRVVRRRSRAASRVGQNQPPPSPRPRQPLGFWLAEKRPGRTPVNPNLGAARTPERWSLRLLTVISRAALRFSLRFAAGRTWRASPDPSPRTGRLALLQPTTGCRHLGGPSEGRRERRFPSPGNRPPRTGFQSFGRGFRQPSSRRHWPCRVLDRGVRSVFALARATCPGATLKHHGQVLRRRALRAHRSSIPEAALANRVSREAC